MKQRVPAAPQPAFGDATALSSNTFFAQPRAAQANRSTGAGHGSRPTLAPIDQEFLSRTAAMTICLGLALAFCIALRSVPLAASFATGAVLSVALLKSQQWLLRRIVALRSPGAGFSYHGWDARLPLWLLVPLKYLVISAFIYAGLRSGMLIPAAFATGFTVLQVVIFARVAGKLLKASLRPIDQVYIGNAKNR